MRNRNDVKEKQSAVQTACRHYWVIETADGPTSRGICKICGAEKEFYNSWSAYSYIGKEAQNVFNLPNMLEDKKEDEEEKEDDS
jgi:hypothetical protein